MGRHFPRLFDVFARIIAPEEVGTQELIILVVGPAGAGKSTFINVATGHNQLPVGKTLSCETGEVRGVECIYPRDGQLEKRKIVFVDTPGLNCDPPVDVEREISRWLSKTYSRKKKADGILYIHRISDPKLAESPLSHLGLFDRLGSSHSRILLTTTMWSKTDPEKAARRERELGEKWEVMAKRGAKMKRFLLETPDTAWDIVDGVLRDVN